MSNRSKVHAMIVAAGRGNRFGADIPKQYLSLNGQTLLQHSVARLAQSAYIDGCLLVIAADDLMAKKLSFAMPVWYTCGGVERWQSVQAGVNALVDRGADDEDLILIHDAARPTVPCADIEKVIEAAQTETYGAILATPVADTLKQSWQQTSTSHLQMGDHDNPKYYTDLTIDRRGVWQAQTPQVFYIGQLRRVLAHVDKHQLNITDEASAFEHLKLPIRLVTGSRQNIKLTYPEDGSLIAAILHIQQ